PCRLALISVSDYPIIRVLEGLGGNRRRRQGSGRVHRERDQQSAYENQIERREYSQCAAQPEMTNADDAILLELGTQQRGNQKPAQKEENGHAKAAGYKMLEAGMGGEN